MNHTILRECRTMIHDTESLDATMDQFAQEIEKISQFDFYTTIQSLEKWEKLGYEKAFLGFLSVVASNNHLVRNRIFPQEPLERITKRAVIFLMSMRFLWERWMISSEEIVWMIAATRLDFTFTLESHEDVLEMCGMGWDIGFWEKDVRREYHSLVWERVLQGFSSETQTMSEEEYYDFLMQEIIIPDRKIKQDYKSKNKKSVNISTLSSLVLGSLGHRVMKHGSWKNTSAVGSSEAITSLWIPLVYKTLEDFRNVFKGTGFVYTDAMISKTIHDISWSVLKTETVNHLTWPMTPPLSRSTRLHKVLWINHNMSIDTLGKAYELLNEKWIYNVWNVIIVWWLNHLPEGWNIPTHSEIRFDEFSPRWSLIWVVMDWVYRGKYVISDADFWTMIDLEQSLVSAENDGTSIYSANNDVIDNRASSDLIELVACNSALWLITLNGAMAQDDFIIWNKINKKYLIDAFRETNNALSSLHVRNYVESLKKRIKEIVPDTLLSCK